MKHFAPSATQGKQKQPDLTCISFRLMSEESKRFRQRARDCRRLAADAKADGDRRTLTEMAEELDAEADKIEAEQNPGAKES